MCWKGTFLRIRSQINSRSYVLIESTVIKYCGFKYMRGIDKVSGTKTNSVISVAMIFDALTFPFFLIITFLRNHSWCHNRLVLRKKWIQIMLLNLRKRVFHTLVIHREKLLPWKLVRNEHQYWLMDGESFSLHCYLPRSKNWMCEEGHKASNLYIFTIL